MRISSRALIIDNNKILLIHRIKFGKEYYVLPGGEIEKNETPEEAVKREVKEETNLDIEIDSLFCKLKEIVKKEKRLGYYFLVKNFNGKLKLGSPEKERQCKDNVYKFIWMPLKKVKEVKFYPVKLKTKILQLL